MPPPTILICEDEPTLRELIRAALGPEYRCVEAGDGHEALEQLRREQPDVLVLDLMLPGRSGLDILAELRDDRAMRHTPVVVVTAWSHAEEAALAAGADRFLAKPFEPDALKAAIDGLLAGR